MNLVDELLEQFQDQRLADAANTPPRDPNDDEDDEEEDGDNDDDKEPPVVREPDED